MNGAYPLTAASRHTMYSTWTAPSPVATISAMSMKVLSSSSGKVFLNQSARTLFSRNTARHLDFSSVMLLSISALLKRPLDIDERGQLLLLHDYKMQMTINSLLL